MSNYSFIATSLLITAISFVYQCKATTEWFGDLRAHMYPPENPPFYDITYDDETECPFGLESQAIPDFVYFGKMIASKSAKEHGSCLAWCLRTTKCVAVNFFEPLSVKDNHGQGFCELLSESQYDNPRLMRPFRKAKYYEQIQCRLNDPPVDDEEPIGRTGNGHQKQPIPSSSSIFRPNEKQTSSVVGINAILSSSSLNTHQHKQLMPTVNSDIPSTVQKPKSINNNEKNDKDLPKVDFKRRELNESELLSPKNVPAKNNDEAAKAGDKKEASSSSKMGGKSFERPNDKKSKSIEKNAEKPQSVERTAADAVSTVKTMSIEQQQLLADVMRRAQAFEGNGEPKADSDDIVFVDAPTPTVLEEQPAAAIQQDTNSTFALSSAPAERNRTSPSIDAEKGDEEEVADDQEEDQEPKATTPTTDTILSSTSTKGSRGVSEGDQVIQWLIKENRARFEQIGQHVGELNAAEAEHKGTNSTTMAKQSSGGNRKKESS